MGCRGMQISYLDDRSGLAASAEALSEVLQRWSHFSEGAGLLLNEAKTQRWARTPKAHKAMTEAGGSVGPVGEALVLGAVQDGHAVKVSANAHQSKRA
eukprot:12618303-Alexandrium_andersonii.AAC.1